MSMQFILCQNWKYSVLRKRKLKIKINKTEKILQRKGVRRGWLAFIISVFSVTIQKLMKWFDL